MLLHSGNLSFDAASTLMQVTQINMTNPSQNGLIPSADHQSQASDLIPVLRHEENSVDEL